MPLAQRNRRRWLPKFGKKYAINGAGAPKIANTSIRQPRTTLLPRWAQGQRKAKALYFTTEAEAKEELKKWDRRFRKEGEDALAISHNCGFWPPNAQRASNRSKSRFGMLLCFSTLQMCALLSPSSRQTIREEKSVRAVGMRSGRIDFWDESQLSALILGESRRYELPFILTISRRVKYRFTVLVVVIIRVRRIRSGR
jgi:hypothetical protein